MVKFWRVKPERRPMVNDDLAALQARLERLERLVNATTSAEMMFRFSQQEAYNQPVRVAPLAAPTPARILSLAHRLNLPNVGDARAFVEAVALAKGSAPIAQEFPGEWLLEIVAVKAARDSGLSWTESLRAAGLEPPTDDVVLEQARIIRREVGGFLETALGLYRVLVEKHFWRSPFAKSNFANAVAGLIGGTL